MRHRYTQEPLSPDDAACIARTPGAREVARLFPEPSLAGRGAIGVEGGITLVAGPGTGRTTLLAQVERTLVTELGMPCARVRASGEASFYAFLARLAEDVRDALARSGALERPRHGALADALAVEVPRDVSGDDAGTSPRALQTYVDALGKAAAQGGGCALLIDDLDVAATRDWASALVAGLRFTFQAATGVTPIFALWHLYFEESMPGSNYFRNVTRPIFVAPLDAVRSGERDRLIDVDLGALGPEARGRVASLAGGHPALVQRALGDVADAVDAASIATLSAASVDEALARRETERRAAVASLLARLPQVVPALSRLAASPSMSFASLPASLRTCGLVSCGEGGAAELPGWVREALP